MTIQVELLHVGGKSVGVELNGKKFYKRAGESDARFSLLLATALQGAEVLVPTDAAKAAACKRFFNCRGIFPSFVEGQKEVLQEENEEGIVLVTGAGSNNIDLADASDVRITKFKHWSKYGLNYIYFECKSASTGEEFSYRYNIRTGKRSLHPESKPENFYNLAEIAKQELSVMGLDSYEEIERKYVVAS